MINPLEKEILSRELTHKDNSFNTVLYVTNYASVYKYDNEIWDKMNIEGTFIMYKRNEAPFIAITVLNRKNLKDFTFEIDEGTHMGVEDGLMTIHNDIDSSIYGVWFHDEEHPKNIFTTLKIYLKYPLFFK